MSDKQLERQLGIRIREVPKPKCPNAACGAEVPAGAARCAKCGTSVIGRTPEVPCASCGEPLPPGSLPGAKCARCKGPEPEDQLKHRYVGLRGRVERHHSGLWPYARNSAVLRNRCRDWLGVLEPIRDSPSTPPEEVASLSGLIDEIRTFMRDLPLAS